MQPDNPNYGKPSDHNPVVATPLASSNTAHPRHSNEYTIKLSRPLPESGVHEFGQWLVGENWECINNEDSPSYQAQIFEKTLMKKLDDILPQKSVKVSSKDKSYITADLKKLDRLKKREYRKHGRSEKYLKLKAKFELKLGQAAADHLEKNVRSLRESDPGKAYSILKRMGAQPGDIMDDGVFTLTEHLEKNLTKHESVEEIALHFAKISQEYPPLEPEKLPTDLKSKILIDSEDFGVPPKIDDIDVYNKIKKATKPKSGVPGDLPRALMKEFSPELATPLRKIYEKIIETGEWPSQWKIEYGIPLQKKPNPKNEDDVRIISLTAFYSKVMEKFVMEWLLEVIGDKIDWHQYGGQKGNSVAHYLIDFVNFVLYNQDIKNVHAVLAATIDFSKAFNRQNHYILVSLLSDLGVPGWLLRIVIGFLENRELEVAYKGAQSSRMKMPGGGPQGTILGMFLFLILINGAGFRGAIKNTGQRITNPKRNRAAIKQIHMKFIDDMTLAEAIDLKSKLTPNPDPNPPRPVNYHDRTGHVLDVALSQVQVQLKELGEYAQNHQMKVNSNKSKVILFNSARKYDFFPNLGFENEDNLEVVEELKLLGVVLTSNLSWQAQTDYMCQRAYSRTWMIRRLKPLGASQEELIEVYATQIRCILEFAVAVWNAGLTKAQVNQLERVQKCVLAVILDQNYKNYDHALQVVGLKSLSERRRCLCLKFASKALKHEKFSNWFCPTEDIGIDTRSTKPEFKPVSSRTKRFEKSPLHYLTRLLNEQ